MNKNKNSARKYNFLCLLFKQYKTRDKYQNTQRTEERARKNPLK